MSREDAFNFFDSLFLEQSRFHLSRFNVYRVLMDVHGVERQEAYDHWMAYEKSENFKVVANLIPDRSGND